MLIASPLHSASTPASAINGVALAVCGTSDRVDGVIAGAAGAGAGVVCGAGVAAGVTGCGAGVTGCGGAGVCGCRAGVCGAGVSGVLNCGAGVVATWPRCAVPLGVVADGSPATGVCPAGVTRTRSAFFISSFETSFAVVSTGCLDDWAIFIACSRG